MPKEERKKYRKRGWSEKKAKKMFYIELDKKYSFTERELQQAWVANHYAIGNLVFCFIKNNIVIAESQSHEKYLQPK